jgi:hypothetical protein
VAVARKEGPLKSERVEHRDSQSNADHCGANDEGDRARRLIDSAVVADKNPQVDRVWRWSLFALMKIRSEWHRGLDRYED